jgi:hypothetical protein
MNESVSDKSYRENQSTHLGTKILFSKIVPIVRKRAEILMSRTGHGWQHGACALHTEYPRLQTHTQNT